MPPQPATAAAPTAADRQLKAIYDAEWQWRMQEFAQVADGLRTKDGDHLYGVTPADWERRKAYWSNVIAQIDRIPLKDLSPEERLNAQVLREQLRANVTNIGYRTYEAPLNSDSFFWTEVKPYGSLESVRGVSQLPRPPAPTSRAISARTSPTCAPA